MEFQADKLQADHNVVEMALSRRFKPAFDGGYVQFKGRDVEEYQGVVNVDQYLQKQDIVYLES